TPAAGTESRHWPRISIPCRPKNGARSRPRPVSSNGWSGRLPLVRTLRPPKPPATRCRKRAAGQPDAMRHRLHAAVFLAMVGLVLRVRPDNATEGDIVVAARSRLVAPGEIVVLTMTPRSEVDRVKVEAFGRDVPAFRAGTRTWCALIGIDLDVAPGSYAVEIHADRLQTSQTLVVRPRAFPTRRLSVDPDFVNPPESELARIQRETARLNGVWRSSADQRLWSRPFVRPVP